MHYEVKVLPQAYEFICNLNPKMRVKVATDMCRLFYFHHKETLYVCTSGYVKKTDKTDRQEIQRALRLRNDILQEYGL